MQQETINERTNLSSLVSGETYAPSEREKFEHRTLLNRFGGHSESRVHLGVVRHPIGKGEAVCLRCGGEWLPGHLSGSLCEIFLNKK